MSNAGSLPFGRFFVNVLVFSGITATVVSCGNDIQEIRAFDDATILPVQTSLNAEYSYTENGVLVNTLKGAHVDQFEGDRPYIEVSGGWEMTFFDSAGTEEAKMTAVHGRYFEKEKRLTAWESVQLFNTKGEKLETEELVFAQDSDRIYTDKYVKITTANGVLHGQGLESNENFSKYRILKPSGDYYMDKKDSSAVH